MGNLTTRSNLQKERQLQIQKDQRKDSSQRSGDGAEKRILGKGAESVHTRKEKGEPRLAPDLRALSRQGASLSRHTEILGKEHLHTLNRTLVSPEISDEASPIGSRISTKTE